MKLSSGYQVASFRFQQLVLVRLNLNFLGRAQTKKVADTPHNSSYLIQILQVPYHNVIQTDELSTNVKCH